MILFSYYTSQETISALLTKYMLILDQVTNKNFGSVYPRRVKLILSLVHTIQVYISTLVTPSLCLQLLQPLTQLQDLVLMF